MNQFFIFNISTTGQDHAYGTSKLESLASRTDLAQVLAAVLLIFSTFFTGLCWAAEPITENTDLGKPFAKVWRLRGKVEATGKLKTVRQLKEGDMVFVGEPVRAAPDSEAVFKTADGGIVAVRPGAEFVAERFAAEGKASDRQVLRLLIGSLRLITGWIGKFNQNDHRVVTATATIGIRGTDHEPYVLPASMANASYRQGTYDKVNRGSTLLDANGGSVTIGVGTVGFARDPKLAMPKSRALMTILLPVLLSKVPDFYVPGAFDQELDQYSENTDSLSRKQQGNNSGNSTSKANEPTAAVSPVEATSQMGKTPNAQTAAVSTPENSSPDCDPKLIAEVWLKRFDRAIAYKDVKTILGLFAPEVVARATVRSGDGTVTLEFTRAEMVQSTLGSIASLKNYQQRRVSLEANLVAGETQASCNRINIKSIAIEQGLMSEKPYRFEALEEYLLEQREGEWLAVTARTTQR